MGVSGAFTDDIVFVEVTDRERYSEYTKATPPVVVN
jgi:hypothetical protein